ncbi:sensor histidine kinase [Microbacterium sp. CGR2]|uniref:sensor histidine kinase n=1 Tax=Microbacterium sp. CGR2 TaxID=1805820 RepID=UPI00217D93F3|nr:histidine kinase [Microbacterium sp. CGR2]
MLVFIAVGFIISSGRFTRSDLLAMAFYAGLAAFAWHPLTAAFAIMIISGVGVIFTGSGGDVLELAIALSLVAATCAPWVVITHSLLVATLTAYIAATGTTLAEGGMFGIAGIAAIALLAGLAFRLLATREGIFIAERARVEQDLELIAREEQERIADELHDGIAHDLTLILFHARALPKQPDKDARTVSLTTIEDSAERALGSIQSLLSLMRDTQTEAPASRALRYNGQVAEAIATLGDLLKDAGIPTTVSASDDNQCLSPTAERLLIEIAIEAVTNIIKHAPTSQFASIRILDRPDSVTLLVENALAPGVAGGAATSGGRGLWRGRQRLSQHGGSLEAGPSQGAWVVRATVPVPADSSAKASDIATE